MASEGRAAARAQASTAASPPFLLAPTASATAPSSPSSLHLISLPPHERSNCHRLLAPVVRASSRISSAHVLCSFDDEAHEAPSRLRFWPCFRSLPPLAISRPRRPHRPHRLVSSRAPRLSPRAGGCMAADAGATAGAAAGAAAAGVAAARAAVAAAAAEALVRAATRGSSCARACGGVFACDAAINYLRHRSSLAAPASRLSAAATRRPMVRPIGDLMQQFSYVLSALVSCVAWYCIWYVVCVSARICASRVKTPHLAAPA